VAALFARLALLPVVLVTGLVLHGDMVGGGAADERGAGGHHATHALDGEHEPGASVHSMLIGCLAVLTAVAAVVAAPSLRVTSRGGGRGRRPWRGPPQPSAAAGLPPPGSRVDQGVLLRV